MVGLVGYPNVGKSSTINALLGSKKVSVSATPGKTKHFQTLPFTDRVTLCDCPGLVFPQFVNTQADMVCDGVLPIDQMREASAPVELLCRRIPREILEGTYGIRIDVREVEDGGTGKVGWEDLLSAYASECFIASRGLALHRPAG
jgi:large subunit GTPase 1